MNIRSHIIVLISIKILCVNINLDPFSLTTSHLKIDSGSHIINVSEVSGVVYSKERRNRMIEMTVYAKYDNVRATDCIEKNSIRVNGGFTFVKQNQKFLQIDL